VQKSRGWRKLRGLVFDPWVLFLIGNIGDTTTMGVHHIMVTPRQWEFIILQTASAAFKTACLLIKIFLAMWDKD